MSKMVTLKTTRIHRFNKVVIFKDIEVKFDQYGLADVMERHVEELLKSGLEIVDKEDSDKYAELKEKLEIEKSNAELAQVDYQDENTRLKNEIEALKLDIKILKEKLENCIKENPESKKDDSTDIDTMTFKDLKALCKSVELPEKDWKALKLDELKSYLKEKLAE